MSIYDLYLPANGRVPILVSSPHSGLQIPNSLKPNYTEDALGSLDDADWYVDELYSFAPQLGITLITARYHRWVIDLNRAPDSSALYQDGRVITGLMPTTDFNGDKIYKDGQEPSQEEQEGRLSAYYKPYHAKIEQLLAELVDEFGVALLFDAHSIRAYVPGIRSEAFPPFILGDNDEHSASPALINAALEALKKHEPATTHNTPFKGGYITRSFGDPGRKTHALQLEMTKKNYMDDAEEKYHPGRAARTQDMLKQMFESLIKVLMNG